MELWIHHQVTEMIKNGFTLSVGGGGRHVREGSAPESISSSDV